MEERLAYTFLNLLADFGGYLGMFVGGNLLAILDIIRDRSIFPKLGILTDFFIVDNSNK